MDVVGLLRPSVPRVRGRGPLRTVRHGGSLPADGARSAADTGCVTRAGGGRRAGGQPPSAAVTTDRASSCTRARCSGPEKDSA